METGLEEGSSDGSCFFLSSSFLDLVVTFDTSIPLVTMGWATLNQFYARTSSSSCPIPQAILPPMNSQIMQITRQ